jgi:ribosomal protein S18 acetylase RimI-like enzyme
MSPVDARRATRTDIPALSATLGKAFFDDPVMRWILPDDEARRQKLHWLFAALTRYHHLSRGGVEVATDGTAIDAAALWDPPGQWRQTVGEQLRAMPRLLATFGLSITRGLVVEEMMAKVHPEEPHWYLAIIGSDPHVRGKGFGNVLMRSRLDRIDAEHAPAYLESSNPDNVPYYERFGFEVTGEIAVPDGPRLIPMWREPR